MVNSIWMVVKKLDPVTLRGVVVCERLDVRWGPTREATRILSMRPFVGEDLPTIYV